MRATGPATLMGCLLLGATAGAQAPDPSAREVAPIERQSQKPAPAIAAPAKKPTAGKAETTQPARKPSGPASRDGSVPTNDPAELVEVITQIPDAVLELRYATRDNFVGEVMYPAESRCLLRRDVLDRLVKVAEDLRAKDLRLKLWDCYRPIAVQWKLWERFPKPGYVADPRRGGNHNRGAAIDLTLIDATGAELEMPTPFDTFQRAAHQGYPGGTQRSRENRELLRQAMVGAGFRINRSEWWHFDALGALRLPVRDEPLVAGAAQP